MKKFACIVLTLLMCLSLSIPALAVNSESGSFEYVTMSREEYIAQKADRLGISYAEAEEIVDDNVINTIARIPMAADGFEATGGSTDEYGVNTAYGYIVYTKPVPKTASLMKVRMSAYAVIISGPPGRYIAEVETPVAQPGSSGNYTIDATCNADISDDVQSVVISASGNAEIELEYATELGFDAEIISFGQSYGSTTYLRYPFTVGATYAVS